MSRLLPSRSDPQPSDGDPRVVGVDSEDADDLIAALSSETARDLLSEMHEEPGTPSELADRLGTTLQNTQYHLRKLENADVVDVVETVYSEKGREMKVYAPADQPLVLFAGRESEGPGLKTALTQLLGGIGALALASAVAHALLAREPPDILQSDDGGAVEMTEEEDAGPSIADAEATETPVPEDTPAPEPEPTAVPESDPELFSTAVEQTAALVEGTFSALPPGVVFFLGGLTVLIAVFGVWYLRSRE